MSTAYDPSSDEQHEQHLQHGQHGYDLEQPEVPEDPATRARRPSVLHLVVGLVFLGLAGLWALAASDVVDGEDTWLLPGLLVVAGATGLVAALLAGRRPEDR